MSLGFLQVMAELEEVLKSKSTYSFHIHRKGTGEYIACVEFFKNDDIRHIDGSGPDWPTAINNMLIVIRENNNG